MALVELYRATGERAISTQASTSSTCAGRRHRCRRQFDYHQDHVPFRELERSDRPRRARCLSHLRRGGRASRDRRGGPAATALDRQWDNMTERRMYVTGGIGSRYEGEAFGEDYELPNERAYAETCAAIGSVMWNWRMLHAGRARRATPT